MDKERIDKIVALINQLGDLGCVWQQLSECMEGIQTGKQYTRITFATNEMTANDAVMGPARRCFILWLPRSEKPAPTPPSRAACEGGGK